jgi:hypothetical protein
MSDDVRSTGVYLGIDPGAGYSSTIGVVKFSATGDMLAIHQFNYADFLTWLESQTNVIAVVNEEYRIRRDKVSSHVGSKVETIQTIGAIKSYCHRNNVPQVEQRSNILPVAEKLFQIKMPKDHSVSHQISALLHMMFYLYNNQIIKSALEMEIEANNGK